MKQRNICIEAFGWWIRFYLGGTMDRRRLWKWKFDGIKNKNRGITFRFRKDNLDIGRVNCIGIQWRQV